MTATEPIPNQLSPKELREQKLAAIKRIVAEHITPEWQQQGVPRDQTIIDQQLETAARDAVDLATDATRDRKENPYPGDLSGLDVRWYITKPLNLDQYYQHRAQTDSWGSYLNRDPSIRVMFNSGTENHDRWGIQIFHDEQYPGLVRQGNKLAQMFHDCGFPLTPETRQTYLQSPTAKATTK